MNIKRYNETGLTTQEVKKKIKQGLINKTNIKTGKSVFEILKDNIITPFNILNIILLTLILFSKQPIHGLFAIIIFLNTFISTYKELSAKKKLDKIKILNQPKATVIRDSHRIKINTEDIVLNDLLVFELGNQILIDGKIIDGFAYVNESLITGEAKSVFKKKGDEVYSGSYIVSGFIKVKTLKISDDIYVNQISLKAKKHKYVKSDLMITINNIIKIISFFIIPLGAMILINAIYICGIPYNEAVVTSVAAIVGMIPEGLVLLTILALTAGNIKLLKYNALTQDIYAIENLSRVNVLCFDKTGTLTEGTLSYEDIYISDYKVKNTIIEGIEELIAALPATNITQKAIQKKFDKKNKWKIKKVEPFNSEKKWSAVSFQEKGTWFLGAPDILFDTLENDVKLFIKNHLKKGNRVLAVGHINETLVDNISPKDLIFDAVIVLSDVLKKDALKIVEYFKNNKVNLKILSGDSSEAVKNIAIKLGFDKNIKAIDGTDIKDNNSLNGIVNDYDIFGRVVPQQKKDIIKILQKNKNKVGMIGDGVNDVLALKVSDCSIAMSNGSDISRAVSQIVLLDSDFNSIPIIVNEGKKIINNIQRIASLYLIKSVYSIILSIFFIIISNPYVFRPFQLSVISSLMIGIPTFFMAFDNNNVNYIKGKLINNILKSSLPAGISVSASIIFIYLFLSPIFLLDQKIVSTISFVLLGLMHFYFLILTEINLNNNKKINKFIIFIFILMFIVFVSFLYYPKLRFYLEIDVFFTLRNILLTTISLVVGIISYNFSKLVLSYIKYERK